MNRVAKVLIILVILPLSVITPVFLVQTMAMDAQVSAQQGTMQQRVEQYKAKLQTAPSQGELNKLKLRCNVSQERLKAVGTHAAKVQESRIAAYDSINKILEDLTTVLKAKNVSTTNLEAQSKELKAKTDAFASDLTAYKQAVDDAAAADCANDPLALRAALEDARNYHTKLVQEVGDVRAYVNNVIKVTLKQVRADLVTQQAAPTTPATGGTDGAAQ